MEIRLARLEGAYEQIDRRLTDLRQEVSAFHQDVEQRFAALDLRIDQKFTWTLGLIVGTWITTIITILFHR